MINRIIVLITILFFSSTLINPVLADRMNKDEEAVWALEEAYWDYVTKNNIKEYLSLWDENFVGWPGGSSHPAEKKNIADWIVKYHDNSSERYYFDLTPMAVRSFVEVVVAHYKVNAFKVDTTTNQEEQIWSIKITHTWARRDGTWQIITGMAADLPMNDTT